MQIIKKEIKVSDLKKMAEEMFGTLVKGVVDTQKEIMAVNGELHADELALLLENGSAQENLWGVNLYPDKKGEDFIAFDSVINIRPSQGNKSRTVEDEETRQEIKSIIFKLIKP